LTRILGDSERTDHPETQRWAGDEVSTQTEGGRTIRCMVANTEMTILDRAIKPERNGLLPDVARFILALTFDERDHARMAELADKNQAGDLTPDEQVEMDEYRRVADLFALLHSKARLALRQAGEAR